MNTLHAQSEQERRNRGLAPSRKKFRTGYDYFVHEHQKDHGGLRATAAAWHAEADKQEWTDRNDARNESVDDEENVDEPSGPTDADAKAACMYGMASAKYPMAVADVELATANLDAAVAAWREIVGTAFGDSDSGLESEVHYQCAELYGLGNCKNDFSPAQKLAFKKWKELIICATKLEVHQIDDVKAIHLISITKPGLPCAHDDPAGAQEESVDGSICDMKKENYL